MVTTRTPLMQRVHVAASALTQLAGFATCCSTPWNLVCEFFSSKVDSVMVVRRSLFILALEAQDVIDSLYDNWGRILLGADLWRSTAPYTSEAGCKISGYVRVVAAVEWVWALAGGVVRTVPAHGVCGAYVGLPPRTCNTHVTAPCAAPPIAVPCRLRVLQRVLCYCHMWCAALSLCWPVELLASAAARR